MLGHSGFNYCLVGCFGFNGPLRQYFSLYRAVYQREGERRESIDESKNVQTKPTRTYCKRNRPLPYCNQNCRTPRHWKFTQHHRTIRPSPVQLLVFFCSGISFVLFDTLDSPGARLRCYFWLVESFKEWLYHGPSMFAVKAKIYGVLYKQASSIAFDETSSYWSALKSS